MLIDSVKVFLFGRDRRLAECTRRSIGRVRTHQILWRTCGHPARGSRQTVYGFFPSSGLISRIQILRYFTGLPWF